ncbi:MAG TPA: universal stress protein [Dictyobacter sp.]|jgi:nucleotide-binding universal stress UspA family protein|nr:universal stress protein [Dictyobacter sp.]
MFQYILVPLDGSPCAEHALPLAARIAQATKAKILLMHVQRFQEEMYGDPLEIMNVEEKLSETSFNQEMAYLTHISHSPLLAGLEIVTDLIVGNTQNLADTLLNSARKQGIDLIVICSRGYIGARRFMLGSIAQLLERQSTIPVLNLRENLPIVRHTDEPLLCPFRILVALDGTPASEAMLRPAAMLSEALSAPAPGSLHLMRVVQPSLCDYESTNEPPEQVTQAAIQAARTYLEQVKEHVESSGYTQLPLDLDSSVACHDDCAETIIGVVQQTNVLGGRPFSTIGMVTSGRRGVPRWWYGSVTEHIRDHVQIPLLVMCQSTLANTESHLPLSPSFQNTD